MAEEQDVLPTRKEILSDWVFSDEGVNVLNPSMVKSCGATEQALVGWLKARSTEKIAASARRKCFAIILSA